MSKLLISFALLKAQTFEKKPSNDRNDRLAILKRVKFRFKINDCVKKYCQLPPTNLKRT